MNFVSLLTIFCTFDLQSKFFLKWYGNFLLFLSPVDFFFLFIHLSLAMVWEVK
ncbi:MAG: hypothetical protein BWY67_02040 [Bacteroidetes bacterium ADurb.Bin397]|nr:MAG: hypothetical protein BWY67_02040 [Bacteroidetes bacterium ADurb.Bin397]